MTYATVSCEGSRERNEDFVTVRAEEANLLLVVADGLGGHSKGEVASNLVATTISEEMVFEEENVEESIKKAMKTAQERLLEKQTEEQEPNGMKTTAVTAAVVKGKLYMGHVGDSRGYVFLKNGKVRRTTDHSIPQLLALSGEIKEKDIRNHPQRSSLVRVFGVPWEREEYEFQSVLDMTEVKAILLCSDGFWELIHESRMKACMIGAKSAKQWLDRMRRVVERHGKGKQMDNYSAVAVLNRQTKETESDGEQ